MTGEERGRISWRALSCWYGSGEEEKLGSNLAIFLLRDGEYLFWNITVQSQDVIPARPGL